MKNLKHFLLISVLSLVGLGAKAYTVTIMEYSFMSDGIYYTISSDSTVHVTHPLVNEGGYVQVRRNLYKGEINIPPAVTYNGKTYTVIGILGGRIKNSNGTYSYFGAFYPCDSITKVTIRSTVTDIGGYTFQ